MDDSAAKTNLHNYLNHERAAVLAKLDGLDSLLSIVQMPAGIPVATVSIGGAANAGLLAARILGSADPAIADRLAVGVQEAHEAVVTAVVAVGVLAVQRRSRDEGRVVQVPRDSHDGGRTGLGVDAGDRDAVGAQTGAVRPEIHARYPLAEVAEAHRALEARETTGSTILVP